MKSLLLHIVIIFLPVLVWAQDLRPEIKNIVNKLGKEKELHHRHIGNAGVTPDEYRAFLQLRDSAKLYELIALVDHPNSVIKGYASWALADRKFPGIEQVLISFLDSRETVRIISGCLIIMRELSSEFYERVRYQHYENQISKEDSLFFAGQVKKLDSIIIYHHRASDLLEYVLADNNANPATYQRVRELAWEGISKQAIIELAKYRKQEDIEEIKNLGKKSFEAISYFPDEKFWPFLERYFKKVQSRDFYFAIASFKNEKASSVLLQHFYELDKKSMVDDIVSLYQALATHYDDVYMNLLLMIWEKYKLINTKVMLGIMTRDPEAAALSFAGGLLQKHEIRNVRVENDYSSGDSILEKMLYIIKEYQSDRLPDVCKFNLEVKDFYELETVLNFIKENKLAGFEEIILERLSKHNIPYDIYNLTESLLSYKNPGLQSRTIKILKMHPSNWKIGNWANKFKELFEEYRIKM